jgi:2Fe-2S ferredoxin
MPTITWILHDGRKIVAEAQKGHSLMEAAVANDVPEILGECGGCLSCATCHVYVDPAWQAKIGGPKDMENELLEITAAERRENSRLSCQIVADDELDGLVVQVPHVD